MCGRFYIDETLQKEIMKIFSAIDVKAAAQSQLLKSGEIFPSDDVLAIMQGRGKINWDILKWGYKRAGQTGLMINARSETAGERPMFRQSLRTRRCAIPMAGFFEWAGVKDKQKYYFTKPHERLFLAGLYELFEDGTRCTILTAAANESMVQIHNRMPVLLSQEQLKPWLSDSKAAADILMAVPPMLVKSKVKEPKAYRQLRFDFPD